MRKNISIFSIVIFLIVLFSAVNTFAETKLFSDISKYFDTAYFAADFKGEVIITGGLGDGICPPLGVVALYNALSCKKSITFTQCFGHGGDQGKYCESFSVINNSVIDPMQRQITDNGCSVSD